MSDGNNSDLTSGDMMESAHAPREKRGGKVEFSHPRWHFLIGSKNSLSSNCRVIEHQTALQASSGR